MYTHIIEIYYIVLLQTKTWLPEPGSSKSLPPFTVLHESENSTDVKITTAQIEREEVRKKHIVLYIMIV
jgi:hypothetical protein